MEATRAESPPLAPPRLNPFALPSDTTSRFFLLIVAVLAASVFAYNLLSYELPSTEARFAASQRCTAAAEARPLPETMAPIEKDRLFAQAQEDCKRPYLRWVAAVIFAGALGVLLVALLLYALTPTWKIRRRRLVPLEEDDAPELVRSFGDLCHEAGLERPPELLWNPLEPSGGALAFGRFGRFYVAVGAALVVQYYTNPGATEGVLRHEVAHVVNRDVNKAYLAQSLWYSFLLAGLLPLLVLEVVAGTALEWESLWRLAALVILIYGARNSVLRSREYYADASAGTSQQERVTLAGILERMPRGDRPVTRLLRVHPHPDSRARALWDSGELFRPRLWDALAAGLLAGFAYPTLKFALFFAVPLEYTLYIGAGAALVSASLMGVVLGTGVWRASLAARARATAPPRLAPVALAAALGFWFGSFLSLTGDDLPVVSAAILTVFMLITIHWLFATADVWFDAVPGTRSGRLFSWAGIVAAAVVVWGTGWVSAVAVPGVDASAIELAGIFVAEHALTPVLIGILVLFPLTASLLRRHVRDDAAPSWVMTATAQPGRPPWPQRPPLAVASALRWGALGGAAFCLIILALGVLDVSPRVLVKPLDRVAFEYAAGLHYAPIGLAVLLQAGVAAVAAVRARRLPVLQALQTLPASFVLMTLGVVLAYAMDTGDLPVDLGRITQLVLTGGAIAALVVGGATEALRRAPRPARAPLLGLALASVLLFVPWGRHSTSGAPSSQASMSPAEAHRIVGEQIAGDPALPRGLTFESFDALAQLLCRDIDTGGSARRAAAAFSQQPTASGVPMRPESARSIVSASIRAYCPHHVSQLEDLDLSGASKAGAPEGGSG